MKKITLILLLIVSNFTFSQSNFDRGFRNGYKEGYCHNKGVGCIKPIAPNPPLPNTFESFSSYQDGYNRGFAMGLDAGASNKNIVKRKRYKTASPEFIDYVYKPNYQSINLVNTIMEQLKQAMKELEMQNYDNTIFICRNIIKQMPDQLMANQLISMALFGKHTESGNTLALIESYNYALKTYQLSRSTQLLKEIVPKLNRIVEGFLKVEDFDSVFYLTNKVIYKNNFTNYWNGFTYYIMRDFKKAKKFLKKVKNNENAKNLLKSIKKKKYYPNPFTESNE